MNGTFLHNPDDLINNRYKIIENIGQGAMGEVYVAEDGAKSLQKIAVKYLKWQPGKPQALEQFKSEFALLTHLSHPNIAKVYDFEQDTSNNQFFYTTELIDGRDFVNATNGLSVEEVEDLFVQSLRALEYLHGYGILHFDIKAANILVSEMQADTKEKILHGSKHIAKVIDFGLATIRFEGRIVGTPSYMAPEMVRRESPDGRADLYSLGVLIYSIITGNNPFRTPNVDQTMQNQLNLTPPPPSSINSSVPKYLDTVIMKLLEKRPEERYQRAADVIKDLSLKSCQKYSVETEETQTSYIPLESRFIGRREELKKADSILSDKKSGVILVSGASGSGKTRFLTEIKYQAQLKEWGTAVLTDPSKFDEWEKCALTKNDHPLFVAIDDFHVLTHEIWGARIEEGCKKIADRIIGANSKKDQPIILLVTTDSSEMDKCCYKDALHIELANFTAEEIKEYLSSITGLTAPPQGLIDIVSSNTGGNPFIVTELVKALVTSGMLVDSQGRWKETTFEDIKVDIEKLQIPSNVEERLINDYKSLPDEAKAVPELLATLNRPASANEIEKITGRSKVQGDLMMVSRRNIIKYNVADNSYFFARPILSKAIYHHVKERDRAAWHDKIARHMAKTPQNTSSEDLLYHVGRGSCNDAAKQALQRLIEKETNEFKNHHAVANAQYYLKKWNDPTIRVTLAKLYNRIGRHEEAIKTAEAVESGTCDKKDEISALEIIGIAYLRQMNHGAARQHFLGALQMAEDMPVFQKLRIENFLAEVAYFEGNTNRAIEIYIKTATEARTLPKEDFFKVRNNNLGQAYFQKGEFKKAIEILEADSGLYQGIEDNRLFARIKYMLAESYRIDHQYEKAKEAFNSLIEYSKNSDDLEHLFRAYNGIGNLFNDQAAYKDAAQYYERAIDISGRRGMDEQTITCIANLGIIYSNAGDMKKALEYFSSALAFLEGGRTSGGIMEHYHGRMHLELGEIARINKNFGEAMDHLKEALEISQKHGLTELSFWIYITMAKAAKDSGNTELMKELIQQATPLADSADKKQKLGDV